MKILVTGGCGFVGTILVNQLLKDNHHITVVDTQWFGNFLPRHKNLKNIKSDIRKIDRLNIKNIDTIIHLASIANDTMTELDLNLSWETSALGTMKLMDFAVRNKVKRIIYASSGSVYGVQRSHKVKENLPLEPISLYNKAKMCTERIVLSYRDKVETFIIRAATICGYSPRMRFDLSVNALSSSAFFKKKIILNGGQQIRPNIHIDDVINLYIYFLTINKKYSGIYNAGFENLKILDIAKMVSKNIKSKVIIKKNYTDPRSYRLNSDKLLNTGFRPKKNVQIAINELQYLFNSGTLKNKKYFYSVQWLKEIIKKKI